MKPVLTIIIATALAASVISCGSGDGSTASSSSGSAPPPSGSPVAPAQPVGVTGTWIGTGVDSNAKTGLSGTTIVPGTTIVTWTLTQTDASVSGTVTTQSTDPPGTCNSCHRSRTGTLSGTIAGTTLTWTLSFPADAAHDPTPICTATLTGTVSIAEKSLGGPYTGDDLCEEQFLNGTLTLARQP